MSPPPPNKVAAPRSDVFISYSRKDREFVRRLEAELESRGRQTWVDWEGIRPAEEFMQAIFPAIEGTDTFIFVLSPDSVTSEICGKELAHAVSHNKRMIPIMARETDAKMVPEPLAKLNWVFARDADSFEAAADFLISALDTDLGWVRAHTRLLTRALEWEGKAKSNSFVLRGEDLRAAEQWLAQAGTEKERQPTALQTEYIIASRKAAARRQRITLGAVSFGFVLAIVLSIIALLQSRRAATQETRAKRETSQSEFLRASAAWDGQDSTEALLGLAKALEWNPANTEAATALINLLGQRQWPHRVASRSLSFPINHLLPTPDGRRIIVAGDQTDGGLLAAERAAEDSGTPLTRLAPARISVLDGSTLEGGGDPIPVPETDSFGRVIVNKAADRVLVRDSGTAALAGNTFLIDMESRRVLKRWTHPLIETSDEWFSTDGKWALMRNQRPAAAGATPQHWVEIVSAADAAPHATLPRITLPGAPVAAIVLENEVRFVHGDGRVVAQTLGNSKSDAARTLLTVKDIADLKGLQFAPDGRSFVAVKEGAVTLREIPEPQKQKTTPEPVPDAFEIPIGILNREFSRYHIGAVFRGPDEVTFQANFQLGETLNHVWRVRRDAGADMQVVAERTSAVAPLCVLPTGIVYGAGSTGTMAFIEPFDGGAFSGTLRHAGQIKALCAMGGNALATASDDGEVKLWRFSAPALTPSLNQLPPPEGAAPDSPAPRLLARNREHARRPVELWAEKINPPPTGSEPDADNSGRERLILVQNGQRHAVDLGDSDQAARTIEGADLSSDGRRAVFYGQMRTPVEETDPYSAAWMFETDKPDQVFPVTLQCRWAGFAPDGKVLIILGDRLHFWDDAPAADGGRDFKPTGRVLPVNSQSAVSSANRERLATWSPDEVLVWDTGSWKPLHRYQAPPGWNFSHTVHCGPALSDDGRRLAIAYGRVFVIWDVASAKRLSDPIDCKALITSLAFTGAGSTQVDATVENGTERRVITWNYADVTDTRDEKGVKELSELARTVAGGDWVTKAPGLMAGKDCPKIIAALLEHFAAQARAIREKGVTPAPSAPK